MVLKLRRSCLPDHLSDAHQLRYQGLNDNVRDKSKPTITRTVITSAVSRGSANLFLDELGFRLDFHHVTRGLVFHKDRFRVTVSRVFKVEDKNRDTYMENDLQMISSNWLVEASCTASSNIAQVSQRALWKHFISISFERLLDCI